MTATHSKKKTKDCGKLCHFYSKKYVNQSQFKSSIKLVYMYMLVKNVVNQYVIMLGDLHPVTKGYDYNLCTHTFTHTNIRNTEEAV